MIICECKHEIGGHGLGGCYIPGCNCILSKEAVQYYAELQKMTEEKEEWRHAFELTKEYADDAAIGREKLRAELDKLTARWNPMVSKLYNERSELVDERDALQEHTERLTKQNAIVIQKNDALQKRLDMAVEGLKTIRSISPAFNPTREYWIADEALTKIWGDE
jgi:chromosome segregation ATPase